MLFLAVEREDRRLVLGLELQHLIGIEHDRVAERKMGRDGDQGDGARGGKDERPTHRESVGGAARRGRDDEAVRPVDDERLAVDPHGDVYRANLFASRDDDVVQRERAHDLLPRSDQAGVKQRALLDREAPRKHVAHGLVELVDRRRGQEAKPSEVHSKDRNVEGRERAGRAQHRPVAAKDERDVGALDLFAEGARIQRELHRLVAGLAQLVADGRRGLERRGPIRTGTDRDLHPEASRAAAASDGASRVGAPLRA